MIVAGKNEEKAMFEKNLQLLTPWLKETLLNIDEEELWQKIEITYNDEGYPICRYHQDNTSFQITSSWPLEEAEKWGKTIPKQETGAIFLYGSGFGYPLFEIFAHKKPHTLVVLFEQDLYLFKAMLYYFDFEPIIKTRKIAFFVGDSTYFASAFDQLFFSISLISCTFPAVIFTHAAQRNFKAQYLSIHKYIFSQLSLFVFYLGNDHKDNLIGFHNLLANVKEIMQDPYISCLKDKYKDVPAFIIANGPSLDKNIRQLKKIQGKGLIISVESAIIPLLKNNIKPDILSVVERTSGTYTCHFKNMDYPDDIALLCLALVDKRVYPSFSGEKIPIFRKSEAINQWINDYLGDGSSINAGTNVSHLATELAVYLGANPIVFVGQDLAFGADLATHSKDSIYYEERGTQARESIQAKPLVYVEGNDGTMIPSCQLWVNFKQGLERKIATHANNIFLNATEGGAKIEGTKCEHLNQVIEEYCIKSIPCRVNEIISQNKAEVSIAKRKEGLTEYIKSAEKYILLFRNLVQETVKGKQECQKMIRLSQEKDSAKYRGILEEAYLRNNSAFSLFITDYLCRCFSQQVLVAHYYMINRLGLIDTPEKRTEIFKIQYNFFRHLNIISQSVSVHLENAIESMRNVLNDFENIKEGA